MPRVNYREKWQQCECEKLDLHKEIQELKFLILAIRKMLADLKEK